MLTAVTRSVFLIVTLSSFAAAQSFNIDVGDDGSGLPSASYGSAAQQPGPWNAMSLHGPGSTVYSCTAANLVDVSGNATSVGISAYAGGELAHSDIGFYGIPGEIGRLMNEGIGGASNYLEVHFTIMGLAPGAYEVWTYAGPGTTILVAGAAEPGLSANYGAWQGFPVEGQHYARHHVHVASNLGIQATWPGWREILAIQITKLDTASLRATCLGDGSGSACPCGNDGDIGRGCATSFGSGSMLVGNGATTVTNDSLALQVDGVSNSVVTFFQGTQASAAGAGIAFGDGLRCATGSVIRLAAKLAAGNSASYPEAGDLPVSIRGAIPAYGGTRIYQVWYRNAAAFCTTATFNWSSGLAASWSP